MANAARRGKHLLAAGVALLLIACEAAPPAAPPPTPPPPPPPLTVCDGAVKATPAASDPKIVTSFEAFSKSWISKLRSAALKRPASERSRILDAFETELRPTGSKQAPWIGILRYCQQRLRCTSAAEATCSPAASSIVTELFRYQGGKWVY
jgi:hypothetical protein